MEMLLSYDIANLQGIGRREYQQDSFGFVNALDISRIMEEGMLAAVADGMGGMQGGKDASTLVMKTLMSDFEKMDKESNLGIQLAQSILHAGSLVYDMLRGTGGSTIVAGIIYDEMLYFASVGDSTIWLVRNNEVIRLNEPHNMKYFKYRETLSNGSMDPSEGRSDLQAHALTQFVGMERPGALDISYRPLNLENRDVIIFCSDGVSEVLSEEEVLYSLDGTSAQEASLRIDQLVRNKNLPGQDNYTALVIRCLY